MMLLATTALVSVEGNITLSSCRNFKNIFVAVSVTRKNRQMSIKGAQK